MDGKTRLGAKRRNALRPLRRAGGLHHRNRQNIIPRHARFMHKKIDMRLQEPAGPELNDALHHAHLHR